MSEVTTVTLEDVEPIPLPGGSWSRMVLNDTLARRQRLVARLLGVHAGHA